MPVAHRTPIFLTPSCGAAVGLWTWATWTRCGPPSAPPTASTTPGRWSAVQAPTTSAQFSRLSVAERLDAGSGHPGRRLQLGDGDQRKTVRWLALPVWPVAQPHAFLWQNGSMQDLGALGWNQQHRYDINDKGQVVGALQTGQNSHAFVWANGQMQDLNNLIPADSGWVLSRGARHQQQRPDRRFWGHQRPDARLPAHTERLSLDQPERRLVARDHELGPARRPRRRRYRHLCPERAVRGGCQRRWPPQPRRQPTFRWGE